MKPDFHASNRSGFTLIELLVSSAVMAMILAILLGTLTGSMSLWRNTESKMISDREARAAQLLVAQDLGSVFMSANPALWPRVITNRVGRDETVYLKFLTTKPLDYQSQAGSGNYGDVCYVEYVFLPSTNPAVSNSFELRRYFSDSRATMSNVIQPGVIPLTNQGLANYQPLGLYVLPTNKAAVRGLALGSDNNAPLTNKLVVLGTNYLPVGTNQYTNNRPTAIEITFAVADPDTLANTNLVNNQNIILRNAGLYSTRFHLPPPQ